MLSRNLRLITIFCILLAFSGVMAQAEFKNQIRFKVLNLTRDSSDLRFKRITENKFSSEEISSVQYEEKDKGYSITDEVRINRFFGLFVTAGYYGQFHTQIDLLDGRTFIVNENIIFGFGGLRAGTTFKQKISVFVQLGYGYWRDRARAMDLSKADLDPPEETLYHTSNFEGFSPVVEWGLTYHFSEILGLTAGYETTDIHDVDQSAWSAGISLNY